MLALVWWAEFEIAFFGLVGVVGVMLLFSNLISGVKWLFGRPLLTDLTFLQNNVFWLSFSTLVWVVAVILVSLTRKQ